MRHGYTNRTEATGASVRKEYQGPEADRRQAAEVAALHSLAGRFPVPALVASGPGWVDTALVIGEHGQDLIDAGHGAPVLAACGRALRELHSLEPSGAGTTLVHGDFGPNNVLLSAGGSEVVAVLDWEFSHPGDPIEDLAWCEWIVRMHHPHAVGHLGAFFAAYGSMPTWPERQREMLRRCRELGAFVRRWDPTGPAVSVWRNRSRAVETWVELEWARTADGGRPQAVPRIAPPQ